MEKFPTFKGSWPRPWTWIRSYCILSCITHTPLPTYQNSLTSKKLFLDGRMYLRTGGHLRPTLLGQLFWVDLNIVKKDCDSMEFRLLQTSLSVPTLQTTLDTTDRLRSRPLPACFCNRDGRLADRTAVVSSWLHNHAGDQPFLWRGRRRDQLIMSLKILVPVYNFPVW